MTERSCTIICSIDKTIDSIADATAREHLPLPRAHDALSRLAPTSAVPLEGEGVAALPRRPARGTDEVVGAVALLAETAVLAASGREPPALAVLHDGLRDPLDTGVVADRCVRGINGDHLHDRK